MMFKLQILLPYNSYAADYAQKESVELNFVYLREGCSKTCVRINDAIPHTWIDMEYRVPQSIQEMSAVRCPVVIENFHIFT